MQTVLLYVLGAMLIAFFTHLFLKERDKRERFDEAAITFRRVVLSELEGIYPVVSVWDNNVFPRFHQSIPKIESAAAQFRYFVKRKTEFDSAVKEYRDYCSKVTYEGVSAWHMYPSMRDPGDIGPVETFKNVIDHLFSFAERK